MKMPIVYLSLLFTLLFFGCQSNENIENAEDSYLAEVEITSPFHIKHVGEITFMKNHVSLEEYGKKDMIQSFQLPISDLDGIDLNIRVFLGNTLTNYLKELAPDLTISQLVNQGNYQFSFLVDSEIIYVNNLHTGAGTAWTKNRFTTLSVPLISSKEEDSWGRFLWSKFMLRGGGREALSEGKHLLRIEMRPYIETNELIVGDLIAAGELQIYTADSSIEINTEAIAIQKLQTHDEFDLSNKAFDEAKIKELNKKILQGYFKDISSIIVLNEGKIQIEEYFNDHNRETLHDTRSVGKSITGALVGLAIEDAHIKDVDQTLGDFYDLENYENYSPAKNKISLKDLLTMTSSLDGSDMNSDSKGSEDNIQASENWINYTLNLANNPQRIGKRQWDYFTGGVLLLGDIIHKSVPKGLHSFANDRFFKPLNISKYEWHSTPQGLVYGGGGLRLSALDWAKIGQIYQNKGKWNDRQFLPKSWVSQSLTAHTSLPTGGHGDYGYLFYSTDLDIDGKLQKVWYAAGNGGNKIYIFQDLPIVIVITATAFNTLEGEVQGQQMLENYILPAIL